jgi:hypothetical protein
MMTKDMAVFMPEESPSAKVGVFDASVGRRKYGFTRWLLGGCGNVPFELIDDPSAKPSTALPVKLAWRVMEFTSKPEERSEGTDAWERTREKAADSDKRVEGRKSMVKIVRAKSRLARSIGEKVEDNRSVAGDLNRSN